jgi:hypothetical protein
MVRRFVFSFILVSEEALAHWGISRQEKRGGGLYFPSKLMPKFPKKTFFKEILSKLRHGSLEIPYIR